jgi:Leucine-rich repeat (LRR) protein
MQLTYIGVVVTTILFWIQEARGDPDDDNSTSTNCPGGCLYDGDMNSITCIDSGCERFPVELIENDIVRIDVSYNAITSVPKLVYPQLTYLDLSNNAITKIDEHTFSSCPELQHLNLSVNVLTIITSYMFKMDLGNTLELDLSNNRISFIEMNSFLFMHKLAKLNISHNNLAYLNNSAINQNALTILDLEDNLFTEVDMHYFQDLSYLQYLSLRKNAIHAIEEDSFTNLDHLQWLDLGENQLEDLLENIFHEGLRHPFSELQKIHLDRNCLKTIHDKTFSPFPKLKYIFLDDNDLRSIGSDQPFPESLTKVSLRRNLALISIRNGTFSGLKELQTVDISGCYKLTEIEPGAFDEERSSVSQFDASQCGLFHLSASLLNWKNVTELDLSGNPWDCDCDLTWPKSTLETETLTNML